MSDADHLWIATHVNQNHERVTGRNLAAEGCRGPGIALHLTVPKNTRPYPVHKLVRDYIAPVVKGQMMAEGITSFQIEWTPPAHLHLPRSAGKANTKPGCMDRVRSALKVALQMAHAPALTGEARYRDSDDYFSLHIQLTEKPHA